VPVSSFLFSCLSVIFVGYRDEAKKKKNRKSALVNTPPTQRRGIQEEREGKVVGERTLLLIVAALPRASLNPYRFVFFVGWHPTVLCFFF
jgi:hypothetical protein